jgi:hypothetical protein
MGLEMIMSAIFKDASGSLRGTLLRAGGFLGFDMLAVDPRIQEGANERRRHTIPYESCR